MRSWARNSERPLRRPGARLAFAVVLACAASFSPLALAQRVLVLRPPSADPVLLEAFNRLRAELELQAFEVSVREASEERVSPEALEREAQRARAFAGISLTRSAGGATVDVCIADRVTGKASLRRLAMTDGSQAPRVLAVRAVDLLRSSVREYDSGERPPPDVIGVQREPVAPEIQAWSSPPPRWQLRAAGSALGAALDVGPAYGASVAVVYRVTARLRVGVSAAGPLLGARYSTEAGSASIRQELALAGASFDLLPSSAWSLGPTLAAGAYHLQARGEVDAPLVARSDGVWSAAAAAGAEAELQLTRALALAGSVQALFLAPRPAVAIDRDERTLSTPLWLASLGVGVSF